MIRGHFGSLGGRNAPYLRCYLEFPEFPNLEGGEVDFLVDTGAVQTTLSRPAAENMGLNMATLPGGGTSTGVGGVSAVRNGRVPTIGSEFLHHVLASYLGIPAFIYLRSRSRLYQVFRPLH